MVKHFFSLVLLAVWTRLFCQSFSFFSPSSWHSLVKSRILRVLASPQPSSSVSWMDSCPGAISQQSFMMCLRNLKHIPPEEGGNNLCTNLPSWWILEHTSYCVLGSRKKTKQEVHLPEEDVNVKEMARVPWSSCGVANGAEVLVLLSSAMGEGPAASDSQLGPFSLKSTLREGGCIWWQWRKSIHSLSQADTPVLKYVPL